MKGEELLNALSDVDDRFIEEAVIQETVRPDSGSGTAKKEESHRVETVGSSYGGKNAQRRLRLIWLGSAAAAVMAAVLSVMSIRLIRQGGLQDGVKNEAAAVAEEERKEDAAYEAADEVQALNEEPAAAVAEEAAADQAAGYDEAEEENALLFGATEEEREYITCTTLEDAERLAGFEMDVPDEYEGHTLTTIRCYENEMLELIYRGNDGKESIRIRKASSQDLLAEYNEDYEVDETSAAGDIQVRIRGTFEGIDVVTWSENGFFFSIDTDGTALSKEQAAVLVDRIK